MGICSAYLRRTSARTLRCATKRRASHRAKVFSASFVSYHRRMDRTLTQTLLARTAAAIAEPSRALMLSQLMDARAYTATELAAMAGVAASTASAHLSRLLAAGLIECRPQGKHRYFRITDSQVASALESLMVVAARADRYALSSTPPALRLARSCYDHIAGRVAVALHDALLVRGWLTEQGGAYQLTELGIDALSELGIDANAIGASRRRFAYACMDWSERRSHLGGALGAALMQRMIERGWLLREIEGRALRISAPGRRALRDHWDIDAL
jgi:DNA-binding transcriptional ArsR family regulator